MSGVPIQTSRTTVVVRVDSAGCLPLGATATSFLFADAPRRPWIELEWRAWPAAGRRPLDPSATVPSSCLARRAAADWAPTSSVASAATPPSHGTGPKHGSSSPPTARPSTRPMTCHAARCDPIRARSRSAPRADRPPRARDVVHIRAHVEAAILDPEQTVWRASGVLPLRKRPAR